jgi:hypothetical protein
MELRFTSIIKLLAGKSCSNRFDQLQFMLPISARFDYQYPAEFINIV